MDPHSRTHAERLASRDGYFQPESVIRRVGNSPLVPFLGGGPAVLLQVAHPLVAAGVVYHSDYKTDLWQRLLRTLRALYLIVYGSKAEAAGESVQAVHARVYGRTRERLGLFPAGTHYSASDPELMLWVHATLVEASLTAHRRFVGRLAPEEEEAYYAEMGLVARLFGLPSTVLPARLADFREYLDAQLAGREICVTALAREVAAVILDARSRRPFGFSCPRTGWPRPLSFRRGCARSTVCAGAVPTPCPSPSPPALSVCSPCRFSAQPGASHPRSSATRRPDC